MDTLKVNIDPESNRYELQPGEPASDAQERLRTLPGATVSYIQLLFFFLFLSLSLSRDNACLLSQLRVHVYSVTVWNNGGGIPVQMHTGENCWLPELIFGHLLTSRCVY